MKSPNFQELYRKTYSALGFKLTESDGFSEVEIKAAEARLKARVPRSLRDYYIVAGRETRLNTAFNRLLLPDDWEVHEGKLVFMAENHNVVAWGADLKVKDAKNPKVFQTPIVSGALSGWFEEYRSCSRFLVFMLHLQSAYGGGMPHRASVAVPQKLISSLDAKWLFIGEVGGMRAYNGPGQAICVLKSTDLLSKIEGWTMFAGAASKTSLDAIAKDLAIDWKS